LGISSPGRLEARSGRAGPAWPPEQPNMRVAADRQTDGRPGGGDYSSSLNGIPRAQVLGSAIIIIIVAMRCGRPPGGRERGREERAKQYCSDDNDANKIIDSVNRRTKFG